MPVIPASGSAQPTASPVPQWHTPVSDTLLPANALSRQTGAGPGDPSGLATPDVMALVSAFGATGSDMSPPHLQTPPASTYLNSEALALQLSEIARQHSEMSQHYMRLKQMITPPSQRQQQHALSQLHEAPAEAEALGPPEIQHVEASLDVWDVVPPLNSSPPQPPPHSSAGILPADGAAPTESVQAVASARRNVNMVIHSQAEVEQVIARAGQSLVVEQQQQQTQAQPQMQMQIQQQERAPASLGAAERAAARAAAAAARVLSKTAHSPVCARRPDGALAAPTPADTGGASTDTRSDGLDGGRASLQTSDEAAALVGITLLQGSSPVRGPRRTGRHTAAKPAAVRPDVDAAVPANSAPRPSSTAPQPTASIADGQRPEKR